ncbi:phosphoribosyltransferase [Arthrobacter sp. 92]|jgi:predicted phosphoribosyltransferase|uniref:phosphoribosyltransferase n=1 Tax=Arthrobacter sp. 92 TaxID=3418175 RepID=UPI003CFFDA67
MRYNDREDAGRRLAAALPQFRERPDTVVLGLARGGIPVAAAVAAALHLPLGALLVRKLGIPGHEETAYGALALAPPPATDAPPTERIVRILNRPLLPRMREYGIGQELLDQVESRERRELLRRAGSYPALRHDLHGRTVVLVDDGLATGATMRAAVEAVRGAGAAAVVVAVPVASLEAHTSISRVADSVLSLHLPGNFNAVGSYYRNFNQLGDRDVVGMLRAAGADSPRQR